MPLFFAGLIDDWVLLFDVAVVFIGFCCATSAVYIFNDLQDLDEDRAHPNKKNRPLASGRISIQIAIKLMILLLLFAGIILTYMSQRALMVTCLYVFMNVLYSLLLKRLAIIDVCIIALGFVLRLAVGSSAANVPLSLWIIVMTFLLALFLALAKRRDDVRYYEMTGEKRRAAVRGYHLINIDASLILIAIITAITYVLYTFSDEIVRRLNTDYLFLSAVFVCMGLSRYLFITIVKGEGRSPVAAILSDKLLQMSVVLWLFYFSWVLYK